MAVCGLLLMLCTPFGTAIPLSSFYSYGSAVGDAELPLSDDGSSSAILLPTPPFLFFGIPYTNIFVSFCMIGATVHHCVYTYCFDAWEYQALGPGVHWQGPAL